MSLARSPKRLCHMILVGYSHAFGVFSKLRPPKALKCETAPSCACVCVRVYVRVYVRDLERECVFQLERNTGISSSPTETESCQ